MNRVKILPEPELEFAHGQRLTDPRSGLSLFGPYDQSHPTHPTCITYAVIGTDQGYLKFQRFVNKISGRVVSCEYGDPGTDSKNVRLWPPFPGFKTVFQCDLPEKAGFFNLIDFIEIHDLLKIQDTHRRAFELANLYYDALKRIFERDESFGVAFCIIPDTIWKHCRPKSKSLDGHSSTISRKYYSENQGWLLEEDYIREEYQFSNDFRRQLKARSMEFGLPIQIIRESTLSFDKAKIGDRQTTCVSDRAWNLSTTMYYKAGGKPWRLSTAREGVCYIGLVFKMTENDKLAKTACSAAQMFLDTGDGVVFRGEFGPWYSPETNQYHLGSTNAEELLKGVIKAYEDQGGKKLSEIFLHSRSLISDEDFAGYKSACPKGVKLVGIRVKQVISDMKLYRTGKWPVIRGTMWKLNDKSAYLWTTGFKTDLLTYDGWETPNPLRIDIQHGEGEIEQVCNDIMGLTKLNYNACKLGDSQPVTVGFSDKTGEILVSCQPSIVG